MKQKRISVTGILSLITHAHGIIRWRVQASSPAAIETEVSFFKHSLFIYVHKIGNLWVFSACFIRAGKTSVGQVRTQTCLPLGKL